MNVAHLRRSKLHYFGHLMWRVDSLEKTLMLGGVGAGGEGDNRGWDGWMASLTRWMWVWVNSGSWWWTGRPSVLRFMGSQRVGYDWATELNWNPQLKNPVRKDANTFIHFIFLTGNHKLCYQENIHSLKYFFKLSILYWSIAGQQTFLVAQLVKNPPAIHPGGFPSWEASLEKGELPTLILLGFPGGSEGRKKKKNLPEMQETWIRSLGWEDPLEECMQPPPVFLPGKSPWTGEPGGLQFMGSHRAGHNWATKRNTKPVNNVVIVSGGRQRDSTLLITKKLNSVY